MNPVKALLKMPERWLKRKFTGMVDACLEPVRRDLAEANAKMDRILDINIAPDVLRDFRLHNEALRAIRASSDLVREQNPLFNSVLRDLARIEARLDEIALGVQVNDQSGRDAA